MKSKKNISFDFYFFFQKLVRPLFQLIIKLLITVNCIIINSALYDSLADNEDALAFAIAHEMAHSVLGHRERKQQLKRYGSWIIFPVASEIYMQTIIFELRRMELASDTAP